MPDAAHPRLPTVTLPSLTIIHDPYPPHPLRLSEDLADTLSPPVNNVFIHFKNFPPTESHSLPRYQRACFLSWSPVSTAGKYSIARFQAPALNPSHSL